MWPVSKIVVCLLATILLMVPVSAMATTNSPSVLLQMTVFPDGSVTFAINENQTSTSSNLTIPAGDLKAQLRVSGGIIASEVNGTFTLPPSLEKQFPYNMTSSISSKGSYAQGAWRGDVVVQAVPGFSSPFASFLLDYYADKSTIMVNGNSTLQYGTYLIGSTPLDLNASSVAKLIGYLEAQYVNQPYLNSELGTLPVKNLTVSSVSLTAQYGSSSAQVSWAMTMKGNVSALPLDLSYLEFGCPQSTQCSQYSHYVSSFGSENSTLIDSSYTAAYSGGILGFSSTSRAKATLDFGKVVKMISQTESQSGVPAYVIHFLNTTTFNITDFSAILKTSQLANGSSVVSLEGEGLTIRPTTTSINSTVFTEAPLFKFLGNSSAGASAYPGILRIVGGTDAGGTVRILVPKDVPAPSSTTSDSATWDSVNFNSLASIQFMITHPSSSSGGGGVPEFPGQLLAVAVFSLMVAATYMLVSKRLGTPSRTNPQGAAKSPGWAVRL
jgi:hypothetical protein